MPLEDFTPFLPPRTVLQPYRARRKSPRGVAMSLPSRMNERYKAVDRLCGMAEWPNLRVEQVRLEAGHLNPVAFQFNEIGFVLAGRTVTSYSGNGVKQQYLIEQGTARICPVGTFERDVVMDAPIE